MKNPPQEADLIPGKAVIAVGVGVVVSIVIGCLIAYGIADCHSRELGVVWRGEPPAQVPGEVNAMETRVFTTEAQGLDMHRQAAARLSSYGWVDRNREIVHVPIETAFGLLLAREREQGGAR